MARLPTLISPHQDADSRQGLRKVSPPFLIHFTQRWILGSDQSFNLVSRWMSWAYSWCERHALIRTHVVWVDGKFKSVIELNCDSKHRHLSNLNLAFCFNVVAVNFRLRMCDGCCCFCCHSNHARTTSKNFHFSCH